MIRVAVLGASGIVGQHMMLSQPLAVEAQFVRREYEYGWLSLDLTNFGKVFKFLEKFDPDIVVNLAGENRVDVVEANPEAYEQINVHLPRVLANSGVPLIQCSTQGVFDGTKAPYGPLSDVSPITEYGKQKARAETYALNSSQAVVARLTFVLGVRPFPSIGRRNPLEDMVEKPHQLQVNDRFFSPLMATDAAKLLWEMCEALYVPPVVHLGQPVKVSRFTIAADLKYHLHGALDHLKILPVSHNYFEGIAPRPADTTWAQNSRYITRYDEGIVEAYLSTLKRNESM